MCSDLCEKNFVVLEPLCTSKKGTTIVMFGRWGKQEIVLKTKQGSHDYEKLDTALNNGGTETIGKFYF